MNKIELALKYNEEGHTCSQAILAAYGPEFGLSEEIALKLACSFGGGMGCMGETCGAVTGAFMVIGLKYGRVEPEDSDSREMTDSFVYDFVRDFTQRNKTIRCNDLLGCDRSTPEGEKFARENGIFDRVCTKAVKDAAEILESIIY